MSGHIVLENKTRESVRHKDLEGVLLAIKTSSKKSLSSS